MNFRVVKIWSAVVEYQHFRGPWFLHFRVNLTSETLVSYHNAMWHHNLQDLNLKLHCHENLKSCNM